MYNPGINSAVESPCPTIDFAANPLFWSCIGVIVALCIWVIQLSYRLHQRDLAQSNTVKKFASLTPEGRNAGILDMCVVKSISTSRRTRGKFLPARGCSMDTEEMFRHYLAMDENKLGGIRDGRFWELCLGHLGKRAIKVREEKKNELREQEMMERERAEGFQTVSIVY
jgi:hypothetical protein